jgi:hypothetical protein
MRAGETGSALAVLLVACGGPEPPARGFDFDGLAAEVAAASDLASNGQDCAAAIPAVRTSTATLDDLVQGLVARAASVEPGAVHGDPQPCGEAGTAACSSRFQNAVFHANGRMGTALMPAAERVESAAEAVRVVIWSPLRGAVTERPAVSIAGVLEARALGLVWFEGIADCGPLRP